MTSITHLECSACGKRFEAGQPHNLCDCGGPLLVRYDLDTVKQGWSREWISNGPTTMWRYAAVLPVSKPNAIVSLGEGMTPLTRADRLGSRIGCSNLWVKDESLNPTASFKARGLSCCISMCVELGIRKVAIPSAGNAGSATAAYAASAGLESHIFMPRDVPQSNYIECKAYGANVTLVDGLISDCSRIVEERSGTEGWFEVAALKEPYQVEGSKTIAYEIAEQLRWRLPRAIVYPTGDGVGLIGMWKAFAEMEYLGWIGPERPRMIAVQSAGCAPIVRAFEDGKDRAEFWNGAATVASGIRVPNPLGDKLMLNVIRDSRGAAVAVGDHEMLDAGVQLAADEGIFATPEGAACVVAVKRLVAEGVLNGSDEIVLLNTGSGLKYLEAYSTRFPRHAGGEADKLGGLITPR